MSTFQKSNENIPTPPPQPQFFKKKQVAQAPALPPILAYGCLGPNGVSTKFSDICGQSCHSESPKMLMVRFAEFGPIILEAS